MRFLRGAVLLLVLALAADASAAAAGATNYEDAVRMEEQAADGKCPAGSGWSGAGVASSVQAQLSGAGLSGASVARVLESDSSSLSGAYAGSAAQSSSASGSSSAALSNSSSSAMSASNSSALSSSQSLSGSASAADSTSAAASQSGSSAASQSGSATASQSGSAADSQSSSGSVSSANSASGSHSGSASESASGSAAQSGSASASGSSAGAASGSGSLYDSVLGQTGEQQGLSRESALAKAVADAQAESAAQAQASATAACEARAAAAAQAQAQAEAQASAAAGETRALQQQVQEMNRRRASDYRSAAAASSFSFASAQDTWSKLASSVRQAWSASMHMSESLEASAFASLVATGASYAASSSTYAEAAGAISASAFLSMSAAAQASRLRTHGVLGGMAYLGELALQAQAMSSFFQRRCDAPIGRRISGRKDLFLGVAEALTAADVEARLLGLDQSVCHEGREWRMDSASGRLRLAADYSAAGIAAALLDGERQPDLRSRLELGQLLDALFAHYYARRNSPCGGSSQTGDATAFFKWARAAQPGVAPDDRRTALELLWTHALVDEGEYAWLERLVAAYEQWDVDVRAAADPAAKLVALVASAPIEH